jgi:hypothetical protein
MEIMSFLFTDGLILIVTAATTILSWLILK